MLRSYLSKAANQTNVTGTALNCNHTLIDCYVIDNNGYIVISEVINSSGKFFGQIEGEIMLSLVEKNIYKEIQFNDFNAVCTDQVDEDNDAMTLITVLFIQRRVDFQRIRITYFFLSVFCSRSV